MPLAPLADPFDIAIANGVLENVKDSWTEINGKTSSTSSQENHPHTVPDSTIKVRFMFFKF
jgi:hypothetical protein